MFLISVKYIDIILVACLLKKFENYKNDQGWCFSRSKKKLALGIPDVSHLVKNGHAIHDLKAERVCFCMSQLKQASPWGTTSCVPGSNRGETTLWKFVDHLLLLLELFTKWNLLPDFCIRDTRSCV